MDDEYLGLVLDLVAVVPTGRVVTYGLVAELVADELAASGGRVRGGPRQVGQVMSRAGGDVPWWRVVNAAGCLPPPLSDEGLARQRAEGTPMTRAGTAVAGRRAVWWPAVWPVAR